MRAGGAGIPAFYTPTGVGTLVESGNFPTRYNQDGTVAIRSSPKETRVFNGKTYVLEECIRGDYAIVKAAKADKYGNLRFHATARNFNPDCARAARCTIAEVEEIVDYLHPDEIHLPGIYVHRIVEHEPKNDVKKFQKLTFRGEGDHLDVDVKRDRIARRVAKEFRDGMYVNLGIGIPTLASNHIPDDMTVHIHSENGLLGMGPYPHPGEEDADLTNAGKETVTYLPGSCTFGSSDSFAMIRGKHIDLTVLGAFEVSAQGDLASWLIPGKAIKGMGGAMDLVACCKKVIVAMTHSSKNGPKVLQQCSMPLTGAKVAHMIVTDLCVFEVNPQGLLLTEMAPGMTIELIREKTNATFKISPKLIYME